jgi:hypothetical protein
MPAEKRKSPCNVGGPNYNSLTPKPFSKAHFATEKNRFRKITRIESEIEVVESGNTIKTGILRVSAELS